MSIEHSDGQFSPIESIPKALNRLHQAIEEGIPVKALHIGTEEELRGRQEEPSIRSRLDVIEARLGPDLSEYIIFPSKDEIKKFT